jgi:hypothetical protein
MLEIAPFSIFVDKEDGPHYDELARARQLAEEDFRNTAALVWVIAYLHETGAATPNLTRMYEYTDRFQMDPLLSENSEIAEIIRKYGGNWFAGYTHLPVSNGVVQVTQLAAPDGQIANPDTTQWSLPFIGSLFFQPTKILSQYRQHSSLKNVELEGSIIRDIDNRPTEGFIAVADQITQQFGDRAESVKAQYIQTVSDIVKSEGLERVFNSFMLTEVLGNEGASASNRNAQVHLEEDIALPGVLRMVIVHELAHILLANILALPAHQRYRLLAAYSQLMQRIDPTKKPTTMLELRDKFEFDLVSQKYVLSPARQAIYPFEYYGRSKHNEKAQILTRFARYIAQLLPGIDANTNEFATLPFYRALPDIVSPSDPNSGVANKTIEKYVADLSANLLNNSLLSIEKEFLTEYIAFVNELLKAGSLFESTLLSPLGSGVAIFFRYELPGVFMRYLIEHKPENIKKMIEEMTEIDVKNGRTEALYFAKLQMSMEAQAIAQQQRHINADFYSYSTYWKELMAEVVSAAINKKYEGEFVVSADDKTGYAQRLDEVKSLIDRTKTVLRDNHLAVNQLFAV